VRALSANPRAGRGGAVSIDRPVLRPVGDTVGTWVGADRDRSRTQPGSKDPRSRGFQVSSSDAFETMRPLQDGSSE